MQRLNLGSNHCDFCQAAIDLTPALYACSNFVHNGLPVFSGSKIGAWAVCNACSILILLEKWDDLAERCYLEFLRRHGSHEQHKVRAQMRELCRLFAEHRIKD
jgi:hypothetical protein